MQIENLRGYEIGEMIGKGGMADVYQAYHRGLDRSAAIKFMKEWLAQDDEFVQRFLREARICARLNHPNIVQVYDVDADTIARPYIVMELLEGQTLSQRIRSGTLSEADAVVVACQVLSALAHAHHQGVVHRDVKPANIFLCDGGAVKVMDFGIARAASGRRLTQTGAQMGTAAYMSPEQVEGEADERSDLYSVGVVLYEMLTGDVPFDAPTPVAVMHQQLHKPPPPLPPTVSPWLRATVMRALVKDPSQRFASAEAMLAALQSPQTPHIRPTPSPPPPAPVADAAPTSSRSPVAAGADVVTALSRLGATLLGALPAAGRAPAAIAAALVLVGIVVMLGVGNSSPPPAPVTPVAPSGPVPTLTSLDPNPTSANSGRTTITITGTDFVSGATVSFNGADVPASDCTVVSPTEITFGMVVRGSGSFPVTVADPAPSVGTSNVLQFNVSPVAQVDNDENTRRVVWAAFWNAYQVQTDALKKNDTSGLADRFVGDARTQLENTIDQNRTRNVYVIGKMTNYQVEGFTVNTDGTACISIAATWNETEYSPNDQMIGSPRNNSYSDNFWLRSDQDGWKVYKMDARP